MTFKYYLYFKWLIFLQPSIGGGGETDEGGESDGEIEEPPYRSLSPCGLKRYGTVSSLERLDESGSVSEEEDDTSKEQEELPQGQPPART